MAFPGQLQYIFEWLVRGSKQNTLWMQLICQTSSKEPSILSIRLYMVEELYYTEIKILLRKIGLSFIICLLDIKKVFSEQFDNIIIKTIITRYKKKNPNMNAFRQAIN